MLISCYKKKIGYTALRTFFFNSANLNAFYGTYGKFKILVRRFFLLLSVSNTIKILLKMISDVFFEVQYLKHNSVHIFELLF